MAKITSKEMIKPSSPTPPHLRNLKQSILDQITPPHYIPMIFFYELVDQESLRKSLSTALTEFYPLAGRFIMHKSTLDCNDSGALFVECRVEGNMLEAIKDPAMDELQMYFPRVKSTNIGEASAIILAVQINLFDCGGAAVAVKMNHKVGDANSLVTFMNAWAATSRGNVIDDQKLAPKFDMATLFPPKDVFSSCLDSLEPPLVEKIVTKRLVFNKKDLEILKIQASKVIKDPTRVEAVSSFLMKRFIYASKARGSKKQAAVLHAVNLRPRMDPPLPNHAFGNAVRVSVGLQPVDGDDGDLVGVLRNAIGEIDGDFVKKVQHGGDEFLNSLEKFKEVCLKKEAWFFSSWTRFPVYEVDYGWGKPTWVTTSTLPCNNMVSLMSTSSEEDGIEAWVNLAQEDAACIDFSL